MSTSGLLRSMKAKLSGSQQRSKSGNKTANERDLPSSSSTRSTVEDPKLSQVVVKNNDNAPLVDGSSKSEKSMTEAMVKAYAGACPRIFFFSFCC